MGKGTIYSGGTKGQYTVTLNYGTALRDERLAAKTARKATLESQISTQETAITDLESAVATANSNMNSAIDTYNASEKTDADTAIAAAAVSAKNAADLALRKANSLHGQLLLQLSNVDATIATLNALDLTENKTVWCADYTTDGSGNVAIIEINAEQPTFVIAPGCEAYSFAWGQMIARELMTGPQAYYNAAILPGVQKHKPTFRSGVITSLDYDNSLCSVRLDAAVSSAQNLNINIATNLSNVPVTYMTCDCYAFEEGDKVVVYFQGQNADQPVVIGFVTNPRPCGTEEIFFLVEIGSRESDPARPRGFKGQGGPLTFSTVTYPSPGYFVISGRITGSEYSTLGQGYDPANTEGWFDTLRIRFDVAWQKQFGTDALFTPAIIDVTSHDDYYELAPLSVPSGGGIVGRPAGGGFLGTDQHMGVTSLTYAPRWIDATASMLSYWHYELLQNGAYTAHHHLSEEKVPAWTGTSPGSATYNFQGWTGQTYAQNTSILLANDLDHASEWILDRWASPPLLITIDIAGTPTEYEFARIGGAPRCTYTTVTVPVASPASLGESTEYDTNGEYEMAVVYRLKP